MTVLEAIKRRRTVRKYTGEPIPTDTLMAVLDAARWAPTSGNVQPWELVRIVTPEVKHAVVTATYGGYARSAPSQAWLADAPELIVVCVNAVRTMARYGPDGYAYARLDVAAAVQNMLLAATSLGLGAAWIGGFRADEVAHTLTLDPDVEPFGLVALGYSEEECPTPYRLPLEDILSER